MKRRNIMVLLFVAAILLPQTVYANGFFVADQGASAIGRASAVSADPQDASATWFNPAGLVFLDGTLLSYGGITYINSSAYHETTDGKRTDAKAGNFVQPNLYLVYKPEPRFAFSLGVNAPFALGTDWPKNWVGGELARKSMIYSLLVNMNISYKVFDNFAIAIGIDMFFGSVSITKEINFLTQRGGMEFSGSAFSFGGNVGLIYKPIKDLSLAFSYRSRTRLELDGANVHFFDVPEPFRPDVPDGKLSSGLTLPDILLFGVSYQIVDGLVAELDVNYNMWSVYDELKFDFENDKPEDQVLVKDWSNAVQVRLGIQYTFKKLIAGKGDFSIRAGYVYDQNPVPDSTIEPMLPDADRHDASFGLGVDIFGFKADVGYMFVYFLERTVPESNDLPGKYGTIVHLVGLNIGYSY